MRTLLAGLAGLVLWAATTAQAEERVLDDFENPALWSITASDDVKASLHQADGSHGKALCIDFDFGHVTGYVSARRELPIDYPARYELTLGVRGEAPANALQLKLVDASGDNVWWARKVEYAFPREWQTLKFRQRQVEFAWGPTADRALRRTAAAELVIASGSGAGKGTACFEHLAMRELTGEPAPSGDRVRAIALGHAADYGQLREFDALALRWRPGAAASRYAIELSDDGEHWRQVRQVERGRGDLQAHWLPGSEARFVRIVDGDSGVDANEPTQVELFDATGANAFFSQLASRAPRGHYPRAYIGEQSYWTVFGVDGGAIPSLLGEDGAVEPVPGVGALEPFLVADGKPLSWADAHISHSLRDGDLPMPSVHWHAGGLTLDIDAFGQGTPGAAQALVRYTVRNASSRARSVALALAWRPFQVNPPTQFLAYPGGASKLGELQWDGASLVVDGVPRLRPIRAPDSVRLEPLAAGPVIDWLADPSNSSAPTRLADPAGFASAVLRYEFRLRPGERRQIAVALPVAGAGSLPSMKEFGAEEARVAALWRGRLDRVRISGPAEVNDVARTLRTALGHILVDRSGPALQPGPRAYARSWIRDGALTSSALLRLGHDDVVREFLLWFAQFQFASGKVPCCATARGADPVPENDSDGEFAFAVAELWRYGHDEASARSLWPKVRAAAEHMERLRTSERTALNRTPERAAYFGLMPASISHEGYSDKAAYSYWDDFWTATGYRSAVELAEALGHRDDAARLAAQRREFVADLLASIEASTALHHLHVLPGSADRGDVDPTSSTVALSPGGLLGILPDRLVRNTFERYWRDFASRRDSGKPWDGYTPYEWRNVGSLLRLGERERALQVMAFLYEGRRPAGWNQWAEVVLRDAREPRFLGDMPHGWVASDQIRAVLDLFAYEHEGEHALVLAAGVPLGWLGGPGLALQDLRTPFGRLSWSARARTTAGRTVVAFELQALSTQPPGGIVLRGPWPKTSRVWIDGQAVAGPADAIRLPGSPARVRIEVATGVMPQR
ncbi:MAG: discoidin domain-containing protein [Pseudomonadota bacterium]|nr:discoidin domain-containing protein [Pseudomonadota bacterium]